MENKIVDTGVKVVYTGDIEGDYIVCTGFADIYQDGSMSIGDEEGTPYTGRNAGEYLTYLEFQKLSKTIYAKAVELAKKQVRK